MNRIYLSLIFISLFTNISRAQNVILNETFSSDLSYILEQFPVGDDSTWIDADFDGLPDASGLDRPGDWFLSFGFANADSTDTVMASNAWTENPTPVANYLILPPIHFNDATGMLYWKSAPYQTPKYLDGLQVLVSTTTNFDVDFTDTLKLFAEYTGGNPQEGDSSFSNYTFSKGFVFGLDGQYIEYDGDSMRFHGILRPDSASLAAYAGEDIYIAFCHGTTDDNLMSLDDIMVTGNGSFVAVNNPLAVEPMQLSVFPNPVNDVFKVEYALPAMSQVELNVYDMTGRVVKSISNSMQIKGQYYFDVDIKNLAAGNYNVVLHTTKGEQGVKITKM